MPFTDDVNRILRDHEGYSGDGKGGFGPLPYGDRSTARRPLAKADLRQLFLIFEQSATDVSDAAAAVLDARDEAAGYAAAAAGASFSFPTHQAMRDDISGSIPVGTIVTIRADGSSYIVEPGGSLDYDVVTVGGVLLRVHESNHTVSPEMFGAFGVPSVGELEVVGSAGIPDDTARIQRMVDFAMRNGAKIEMRTDRDYGISSTILIRPALSRNTGFSNVSGSQHFANQPSFTWDNTGNSRVVALASMGPMFEVVAASGGITSARACWMKWDKVRLDGNGLAQIGLKTDWSYRNKYHACRMTGMSYGWYVDHDAGSTWSDCEYRCTVAGVHFNNAGDANIIKGDCWVYTSGFSLGGGSNVRIEGITFTGIDNGDTTTIRKCVELKVATAENPASGNRSRSVKIMNCELAGCDWLVYGDDTDGDGTSEIWNVSITNNHLVRQSIRNNPGIAYLRNANSVHMSGNHHGDHVNAYGAGPSVAFDNVNSFSISDHFNKISGTAISLTNCNGGVISSVFQDCGTVSGSAIVALANSTEIALTGNVCRWNFGITPGADSKFVSESGTSNRNRAESNAIDTTKMLRPYLRAGDQSGLVHTYYGTHAYAGATINAGASANFTVSVPGARPGDFVSVSFSGNLSGIQTTGKVNADGLARVDMINGTGANVTLAAMTAYAEVKSR